MKKYLPYLFIVLGVVLLDQFSKYLTVEYLNLYGRVQIIPGLLDFYHTRNTGIAFSMGAGLPMETRKLLFKILPIGICLWVGWEIHKEATKNRVLAIAFSLILGGAIGNIIDRFRLDYVVDFISVYSRGFWIFPSWDFAIFNIADSAVSIGAFLIAYETIIPKLKEKIQARKKEAS